jgi:hypothetical protein
MLRFVFSVLCAVFLSILCVAQVETASAIPAPRAASFCDLKRNPANYDGQWITVRGRVSMEFEDFSLYDPACNASNLPGVWLTFGGDQDEITVYCCVNRTRKKGVDLEVGGHRVPLVRDEALRELQRVLQTQRLRRPDGRQCESDECYFYRPVTATITGLFLAGQAGGENSLSGYGHLGCCHLLVIKQVADVSAERTQVPAGGQSSVPGRLGTSARQTRPTSRTCWPVPRRGTRLAIMTVKALSRESPRTGLTALMLPVDTRTDTKTQTQIPSVAGFRLISLRAIRLSRRRHPQPRNYR